MPRKLIVSHLWSKFRRQVRVVPTFLIRCSLRRQMQAELWLEFRRYVREYTLPPDRYKKKTHDRQDRSVRACGGTWTNSKGRHRPSQYFSATSRGWPAHEY